MPYTWHFVSIYLSFHYTSGTGSKKMSIHKDEAI